MSYELTFTRGFKEGLEVLPRAVYPIVDRQIGAISADPFARNPNATRMKNAPRTFRVRIGIHVRMLYRVLSAQRRVEFLSIGPRERFYNGGLGPVAPLTEKEAQDLLNDLRGISGIAPHEPRDAVPVGPVKHIEPSAIVEALPWISEDELFLLHVPVAMWPAILKAGSVDEMLKAGIDISIATRIEDYWTNPNPTQVEKLYSLNEGQGAEAIAQRPLGEFLVALDPEQKVALQRLKANGPYLLKGSAGTGKSLVGLYHVRDLIAARAGESMFDRAAPSFGVITYTNTLVDANYAVLRSITPESAHSSIHCSTLDKIVYDLVVAAIGTRPSVLSAAGIGNWLRDRIQPDLPRDAADLLERLGADYIADEIEQVIYANGLDALSQYLQLERRGRKRGLREPERIALWQIYEAFARLAAERKVQTFEQWRVIALRYLKTHPDHVRFASLFVDEAQDFTKVARELCVELVTDPRNLVFAADTGQSIYTVPISWRQCDPRLDFRRRRAITLEHSYRATGEIGRAIAPLRIDPGDDDDRSANASPVFSGPKPRWIDAAMSDHVEVVCREIGELVNAAPNPINAGQVAIIVRDSARALRYMDALTSKGIPALVVEKRTPLRIDGAHVHIVTAHSSKGLGFPIVFVPELQADIYPWRLLVDKAKDEQQREQVEEAEQRLLYVALSRASHRLCIVVDPNAPSPFVQKLDRAAHWN